MNLRRCFAHALDGVAAWLGGMLIRRSPRTPNTLHELGDYASCRLEEFFPAPEAAREVRLRPRWSARGFHASELTFRSAHQPLSAPFRRLSDGAYTENGEVHVRILRHADERPRATLLYLHSWMQPDTTLEELTLLPWLARRLDVNIARMTLPYHGARKPRASLFHGEYFWTADLVRTLEAIRQSVLDARTVVSWIRTEHGGPVGAMGMSLGGMVTLSLACAEERLAFAIPMSAHMDLAGILEEASLLRPMRDELASHGWQPGDVRGYIERLGLGDQRPVVPRERILFVAGRHDRLLSAARVEALWQRWGQPPIHWFEGGHLGIVTHLGSSVVAMRGFLERLGLVERREVRSPRLLAAPAFAA